MNIFYPLEKLASWITFGLLSISPNTLLAKALTFFIYDTLKILILLAIIIYIVTIIRTFLPPEKIKKILSHKKTFIQHLPAGSIQQESAGFIGNILAALLGIITPFCTCSAIPLFLGFIEAGVPLGVTFSFLVASPMINEIALVMLLGLFGVKIALIYIASGLLIAIFAGLIIGRIGAEKLLENNIFNGQNKNNTQIYSSWRDRTKFAKIYTSWIIKKVWLYVVIGVGVGAVIHGYVPTDFLVNIAGRDKWYAVPVATLLGIPLYSNAAGTIPLVQVLTEKGVAMGTALAFMMAVTGLSLPEFLILKRVMKLKLILIFASIVGLGIIFTGYLFNVIL